MVIAFPIWKKYKNIMMLGFHSWYDWRTVQNWLGGGEETCKHTLCIWPPHPIASELFCSPIILITKTYHFRVFFVHFAYLYIYSTYCTISSFQRRKNWARMISHFPARNGPPPQPEMTLRARTWPLRPGKDPFVTRNDQASGWHERAVVIACRQAVGNDCILFLLYSL